MAMSLAAVVQHGQVLEASGLVRSQKIGRTGTCSTTSGMTSSTWTLSNAITTSQLLLGTYSNTVDATDADDDSVTAASTRWRSARPRPGSPSGAASGGRRLGWLGDAAAAGSLPGDMHGSPAITPTRPQRARTCA
jgi:hypothetical protein